MIFIILILIISFTISIFVALNIVWITRLFKIESASYKKSLIALIVSGIAGSIASIIFGIINLGFLSNILVSVITFLVFHHFYKKYYQSSWKKSLVIYIAFIIVSIVISLLIIIPTRLYIFSPFVIIGNSMSPTYDDGDYILINKFNRSFVRGDVIVFRTEKQRIPYSIKRIVGLSSEKIEIKDGNVFINDQMLNETYYNEKTMGDISVTLDQDQYFVLGDNRNKSLDSRIFGPITKSDIEGKILYAVFGLAK